MVQQNDKVLHSAHGSQDHQMYGPQGVVPTLVLPIFDSSRATPGGWHLTTGFSVYRAKIILAEIPDRPVTLTLPIAPGDI